MATFQVKLGGAWRNYGTQEDKILKRAYMAGFPHARFELRGQQYEYNFTTRKQLNIGTGKERDFRTPHGWKAPEKPIVPAGPTMMVRVPKGTAGTSIHVPHPEFPGEFIQVHVPKEARDGQTMLVPVPREKLPSTAIPTIPTPAKPASEGWSTGAKVGGALAVGGMAAGGALLGAEIAEHGAEATFESIGDSLEAGAEAAGDAVGDFGEAGGEWVVDVADSAGSFVMDLF